MLKSIVLGASFLATLYIWWRLLRLEEHIVLKVLLAVVALVPVIGPLMAQWVVGMPERAHPKLRATLNHYGIGGRFTGFGTGRFGIEESRNENGEDWNPTVPELQRMEERKRGRGG